MLQNLYECVQNSCLKQSDNVVNIHILEAVAGFVNLKPVINDSNMYDLIYGTVLFHFIINIEVANHDDKSCKQ